MFRGLKPEEIEVRVGTVSAKGVTMLLYKDARCDQNILDEVYGAENWQRDHKEIKGNLFGGVGVWNEKLQQWIWKWDCGTESNTEKEKGEASDSFKRACFNLGIGRELYTGGLIFVKCETVESNGRYKLKNPFEFSGAKVSMVAYNEEGNKREIVGLEISDKLGNVIFKKGNVPRNTQADMPKEEKVDPNQKIGPVQAKAIKDLAAATESDVVKMCQHFGVKALDDLTLGQWAEAKKIMEKKKK